MQINIPPGIPPVWGKAVPLEQVLINLVNNACDAYEAANAPADQARRVIDISAQRDGGHVRLTIQDYAGGLLPDALQHAFQPFYTTKEVGKGTGLGLSISYGIIADLGGKITVANRNGGARFTITLQVAADVAGGTAG